MNKRVIWSIIFSIVYWMPFVMGGWYLLFITLIPEFRGVKNSISTNLIALLIFLIYIFLYYLVLRFIFKKWYKHSMIWLLSTGLISCLYIITCTLLLEQDKVFHKK